MMNNYTQFLNEYSNILAAFSWRQYQQHANLAFPLRLKLIRDDELLHDWETLDYYWLQDTPKSNVLERHCFNCRHTLLRSAWLNDDDCLHPDSSEFFEMFLDAVENKSMEHIIIAERCPYYQPIYFNCSACGKRIETPMHLHTMFAPGLYDSEPYCSQQCYEALVQKWDNFDESTDLKAQASCL